MDVTVAYFWDLFQRYPGATEDNHESYYDIRSVCQDLNAGSPEYCHMHGGTRDENNGF
jgi:hypothetical protein